MMLEKEMVSVRAEGLVTTAERNFAIINMQLKDVTHEESLLQLPFRGNCINWVMGHITQSRDRMLQVANLPSVWTPQQIERYKRDSAPVLEEGPDVIRLEHISADLAKMHEALVAKLKQISEEELDSIGKEVIKGAAPWSIYSWLDFLLWHETYHVGQLEYLRQLTGKNDKVI